MEAAMPDDTTSLARRPSTAVARTWEVSATPPEVVALLRAAPRTLSRAAAIEHPLESAPHDGKIFVDDRGDVIVLWRRPSRSWLYAVRGMAERVPYPDMLRLEIEPTPHGSRVVAKWERHPLTKSSMLWIAAIAVVLVGMLAAMSWSSPGWMFVLVAFALGVPLARFAVHRRARGELLVAAHAALAAHELGEADIEDSAYRRDR
jgi:hypothetical protein